MHSSQHDNAIHKGQPRGYNNAFVTEEGLWMQKALKQIAFDVENMRDATFMFIYNCAWNETANRKF